MVYCCTNFCGPPCRSDISVAMRSDAVSRKNYTTNNIILTIYAYASHCMVSFGNRTTIVCPTFDQNLIRKEAFMFVVVKAHSVISWNEACSIVLLVQTLTTNQTLGRLHVPCVCWFEHCRSGKFSVYFQLNRLVILDGLSVRRFISSNSHIV